MDEFQDRHQSAVGQCFVDWYNSRHRTKYQLLRRDGEDGDLLFGDGEREFKGEIASLYTERLDDSIRWMHARNRPDARRFSTPGEFEQALVGSINDEFVERCLRERVSGRVLLISIHPTVAPVLVLREALRQIVVPVPSPFDGIYLVGTFENKKPFGPTELQIRQLA